MYPGKIFIPLQKPDVEADIKHVRFSLTQTPSFFLQRSLKLHIHVFSKLDLQSSLFSTPLIEIPLRLRTRRRNFCWHMRRKSFGQTHNSL